MLLGYNTNGFGFHRLEDAIDIIAEAGFRALALTPDIHHLHPFDVNELRQNNIAKRIHERNLSVVIESGARFILDPRKKHRPTLLDDDFEPRAWLLRRCFDYAEVFGAKVVSTWSGAVPIEGDAAVFGREALLERFAANYLPLLHEARERGLELAIEPEPGFLVQSMADFDDLCEVSGERLPLTLDIGHLRCTESSPEADFIAAYQDCLVNVQLDDMVAGVHRHLPFGEGEVDFPAVFAALKAIDYAGLACVELSEASRNAVVVCYESYDFLSTFA